jgi:hypothetical protein
VTLADDLQTVWQAPTTDARLKKRIVRAVIKEVVVDAEAPARSSCSSRYPVMCCRAAHVDVWASATPCESHPSSGSNPALSSGESAANSV